MLKLKVAYKKDKIDDILLGDDRFVSLEIEGVRILVHKKDDVVWIIPVNVLLQKD